MSLSDSDFLRYSRQVLLPEVGETGQLAFAKAHVVIIGIGGLGNLAAQHLAAAGLGQLSLVDGDRVELSNLPRQLLFTEDDLGQNKAEVVKRKLTRAYSHTQVYAAPQFLTDDNIEQVLSLSDQHYDLLLDCSDNFDTRQRVNCFALKSEIPLISASVAHFQGQLLSINQLHSPRSGCYHCLFPAEMSVSQTCQTTGVLGPMVGTLASMQALLALQHLLGDRQSLGKLYRFDGKGFSWCELNLPRNRDCLVCGTHESDDSLIGLGPASKDQRTELERAVGQSVEKDYV